jgi:hypothetical protein
MKIISPDQAQDWLQERAVYVFPPSRREGLEVGDRARLLVEDGEGRRLTWVSLTEGGAGYRAQLGDADLEFSPAEVVGALYGPHHELHCSPEGLVWVEEVWSPAERPLYLERASRVEVEAELGVLAYRDPKLRKQERVDLGLQANSLLERFPELQLVLLLEPGQRVVWNDESSGWDRLDDAGQAEPWDPSLGSPGTLPGSLLERSRGVETANAAASNPAAFGWDGLRAFVARWYREPLGEEAPLDPERLAAAEERLGRPLPEAVREWYSLILDRLGEAPEFPGFRAPEALEVEAGVVELIPGYSLGFALSDLAPNPAVVSFNELTEVWEPHSPSLGAFLLASVQWQTVLALRLGSAVGPLGTLSESVRGSAFEDLESLDGDLPLGASLKTGGRWPASEDETYALYRWGEDCYVVSLEDEIESPLELTLAGVDEPALESLRAAIQAEIDAAVEDWESQERARKERLAAELAELTEGEPETDAALLEALEPLEDRLLRFQRATYSDLVQTLKLQGELTPGQRRAGLKLLKSLRERG